MAIYRNIQMSFWTDTKVLEEFSPSDKLLYLYFLTCPRTNLAGCYEISTRQIEFETGLEKKAVTGSIKRLQDTHKVIAYSEETKEVLLINWWKYNWTSSEKLRIPLLDDIKSVKCEPFRAYLLKRFNGDTESVFNGYPIDTVSESAVYRMDTPVSVTVTDTVSDSDTVSDEVKDIVNHLNEVCGTKYKASSEQTKARIRARMNDGFTKDDFFTVIDTMAEKWLPDAKMRDYLRPETLFGTKFESYLNTPRGKPVSEFDAGQAYLLQMMENERCKNQSA